MKQKQALAVAYEAQLGDSLAQNARITDMLAEQASWPVASGGPREVDGGGTMGAVQAQNEKLSLELMEQKAKATKLEQEVNYIFRLRSRTSCVVGTDV